MKVAILIPSDDGLPDRHVLLNLVLDTDVYSCGDNLQPGLTVADDDDFYINGAGVQEYIKCSMYEGSEHAGCYFLSDEDEMWTTPDANALVWSWHLMPENYADSVLIHEEFPRVSYYKGGSNDGS